MRGRAPTMKRADYSKHKFDSWMRLSMLLALLVFAGFLQLMHSNLTNEVIAGIIGLAGGTVNSHRRLE